MAAGKSLPARPAGLEGLEGLPQAGTPAAVRG